jgi:hypothetical protein
MTQRQEPGLSREAIVSDLRALGLEAGVPYHMQREPAPARVARPDGAWEEILTRLHLWRWERDFPRVEPLLLEVGAQRTGIVGQARSRLVDARTMRALLVPLLQHDPLFLLADTAQAGYQQSGT